MIYPSLSNEDYHANPAISRSAIKTFCESPYKYWAEYLNPDRPEKKVTEAMEFGTAFHMFILEHDKFYQNYALLPMGLDRRRKKDNDIYVEFVLENDGKTILKYEQMDLLNCMRTALLLHPTAYDLIRNAQYEHSYFWEDAHSGLMVKCRPDILRENCIIDLKTCTSADSRTYQKDMYLGMYHVQGAMVREGVKQLTGADIPTVINICVEKTYPYQVAIKIISQSALEEGHRKFKQTLLDMKNCFAENKWESYQPEEVDLPSWAT